MMTKEVQRMYLDLAKLIEDLSDGNKANIIHSFMLILDNINDVLISEDTSGANALLRTIRYNLRHVHSRIKTER